PRPGRGRGPGARPPAAARPTPRSSARASVEAHRAFAGLVPVHLLLLERDPHALDGRELLDGRPAVLAPVARELEAAPRRRGVDPVVVVDPGDAGRQSLRHAVR